MIVRFIEETLTSGGRVGTNYGIDYWNGTLDWTTGLRDKFL